MSIYKPKGKALEYGEYALNINLFCTHSCKYCYCPSTIKTNREEFYQQKEHRKKILENTQKWLNKNTAVKGKHIFLSFIGDPFMLNNDNTITCEHYWIKVEELEKCKCYRKKTVFKEII